MRSPILILVALLVAATLAGCGARAEGGNQSQKIVTVIGVSCEEFQEPDRQHATRTVETTVGAEITLSLCSNPSTGFRWEEAVVSDETVVEPVDHQVLAPGSATPSVAGAAGQEVWTFKALKPGESIVKTQYSRPWQGGEKGVWTFTLTVVIK